MIAVTETDSGAADEGPRVGPSGSREVVVPIRLYKTITVFSSIIAIGAILGGFILLDVATNRTQADPSEVNVALALLGVGLIAFGTVTYAFSTRFRTEGMGSAEDETERAETAENEIERIGSAENESEERRTADIETDRTDQDETDRMRNVKDQNDEREYNNG